jgi:hypothetical protein
MEAGPAKTHSALLFAPPPRQHAGHPPVRGGRGYIRWDSDRRDTSRDWPCTLRRRHGWRCFRQKHVWRRLSEPAPAEIRMMLRPPCHPKALLDFTLLRPQSPNLPPQNHAHRKSRLRTKTKPSEIGQFDVLAKYSKEAEVPLSDQAKKNLRDKPLPVFADAVGTAAGRSYARGAGAVGASGESLKPLCRCERTANAFFAAYKRRKARAFAAPPATEILWSSKRGQAARRRSILPMPE